MNTQHTGSTASPIDEYIAGFPPDMQARLQSVRDAIREAAPGATEIISYKVPTFYLNGNLVHFAAFTKHIGFYPTSSGITAFAGELQPYKPTRGTVRFPHDQPLPLDLIRRITAFRVSENTATP